MYAAQSGDGQGDFASVGIKDQHLEFRFDTGSGIKRNILYMVNLVAVDRVWPFHYLPRSVWADGNLAELAGQLAKIVEL